MAATNYTPIQLYYSSTASAAPTAGNLTSGELAINITDGKLYYKDNGGVVQVIATKGAGTIGGSTTQIQYNNAGALAGNAAMTFNSGTNTTTLTTLNLTNALGAVYGGTAQSAYTQGDVLYASASNTLSKLGIGTVNYILTSSGSVPQWSAPSSISVLTATNLAGGIAGYVPYQSAVDTTTFLAIGAANRVMTSTGTAPQWVTSLTSLTGVSSSSITNTSLTSGRVVYSGASGVETDSASLTFNGTTLSAGGFSTTGLSTLVQTVKIGDSNFSGTAVFAPATPAKLYIGTGTVTDATSAIGATNTTGAISSLAITPIAATNTSVTYTNASTLYIAGAPSAGTNVTLTNPYSLYVAAGAAYFGGAVTFAGSASLAGLTVTSLTDSGLTSGRVTYATTGGLLTDSANLLYSGTDLTVYGITVGRGAGAQANNTAVGASALAANTTGNYGIAIGNQALQVNTTGQQNCAAGGYTLVANTTGSYNSGFGTNALLANTTGGNNTALGNSTLYNNTTASDNTAIGYQAAYTNSTGASLVAIGRRALYNNTTASYNIAVGQGALFGNTTGANNVSIGYESLVANTTASRNTAVGYQAGYSNATGPYNIFIGHKAGYSATTGGNMFIGDSAGYSCTTGDANTIIGTISSGGINPAGYSLTTGSFNSFIGGASGNSNTTGSYNVALGNYSLNSNTTASNNTAVGYTAATSNSTGTGITAIGYSVLSFNTTGSYNTAVGGVGGSGGYTTLNVNTTGSYNTGIGMGALGQNTTASYNTAVGYQAGYSSTTAQLQACFGYQAGYGSTGSSNTFIGNQAGVSMTSGAKNTILGAYNGNQGGLDMRTINNVVVLSDGDGTLILNAQKDASIALQGAITKAGIGITFPATQSASTDANTLDDYEEGTWTPVLTDGVNNVASYYYQFGSYIKVGRMVTINCTISVFNKGSITGGVYITGLPFTSGIISSGFEENILAAKVFPLGSTNYAVGGIGTSSTTIAAYTVINGSQGSVQASQISGGSQLFYSGTYWAAA